MNNIEKLAKTHCIGTYQNSEDGERFYFRLQDLEAFAKALQSSEPVAIYQYRFNDAGSWYDSDATLYELRKNSLGYAWRVSYTIPPSTVSLKEHNKRIAELEADIDTYVPIANQQATEIMQLQAINKTLLDALNSLCGTKTSAGWLGEIDDMLFSMLDDEQYAKVSREVSRAKSDGLQAIAEAEGKEG